MTSVKRCVQCSEDKPHYPRKDRPGQFLSICAECRKRNRASYVPAEVARSDLPDGRRQCTACGEPKEIELFGLNIHKPRGHQLACLDCTKLESQKRYAQNPAAACAKHKRWREANHEHWRTWANARVARLHATDIQFHLRELLRTRLRIAIMRFRIERKVSAVRDLGCTIPELMVYLEAKFQPGMSWDNYGDWHIDHIKSLSTFDLTDREQALRAVHYTNLQPLWAADNIRKG